MTERFVTVAEYLFSPEAHLARTYLEANEIFAVVAEEDANRIFPVSEPTLTVKLKVPESQAQRAAELLDELKTAEPPPDKKAD